jgi:hypothetical protein
MKVMVIANEPYRVYTEPLIKSVLANSSCEVVLVNLGGWTPNVQDDRLHTMHLPYPKGSSKGYCANIRTEGFVKALTQYQDSILYIDADSIVRSPGIERLDEDDKVKFTQRLHSKRVQTKTASGVVYIPHTAAGKTFADNWNKAMHVCGVNKWYSDQISLYQSYTKSPDICSPLTKEFIDWDFQRDSVIWTAKGKRKNNPIYKDLLK